MYCVGADWGVGYNVVQEFAKTHGWKGYHYQNQTDKPDDVSEGVGGAQAPLGHHVTRLGRSTPARPAGGGDWEGY